MEEISIISMLFIAVFSLGCLYLILAPLFGWNSVLSGSFTESSTQNEKEVLLSTLNEIEFEYEMEKLSQKDYNLLKNQYEAQVMKVMKSEAEFKASVEEDEDILEEVEKEIQQAMLQYKKKKGES